MPPLIEWVKLILGIIIIMSVTLLIINVAGG